MTKSKAVKQTKLTDHEIALIAELYALYGWKGAARRIAR